MTFNEGEAKGKPENRGPLPEGEYVLDIEECGFGKSRNGVDYLEVKCKESESGRFVWEKFYFAPKAAWKLKGLLSALSVEVKDGEEVVFDSDFCDRYLVGKSMGAQVSINEWEGKKYNRIDKTFETVTEHF